MSTIELDLSEFFRNPFAAYGANHQAKALDGIADDIEASPDEAAMEFERQWHREHPHVRIIDGQERHLSGPELSESVCANLDSPE